MGNILRHKLYNLSAVQTRIFLKGIAKMAIEYNNLNLCKSPLLPYCNVYFSRSYEPCNITIKASELVNTCIVRILVLQVNILFDLCRDKP